MCLVGAVTKDFAHVQGDVAVGHRNAVAVWGDVGARLVAVASAIAVASGFVIATWRLATPILWPMAAVLPAGAALIAFLCARARCDMASGKNPYRAFMLTQYLAHLALLGGLAI